MVMTMMPLLRIEYIENFNLKRRFETMKIKQFVEMYKANQNINIEEQLEVIKYVSIVSKRELAKLVLENCTSMVDGEIHMDSVERYILFTIAVITMHTNLEFSDEENEEYDAIDSYDMLCEHGLLTKIIDTFADDYAACNEILNMMTADLMQDNMTVEKMLYKFLDGIQDTLDSAIYSLVDKFSPEMLGDLQLNQDNLSQLYKLLKK
jgi:hypothetical protein